MDDEKYYEIIKESLDDIKDDIAKIFDLVGNTKERLIKVELQAKIIWGLFTVSSAALVGLVIREVWKYIFK